MLIGFILSILLNIWTLYSSYIARSSIIAVTHLPIACLFPFVVVVLGMNPLLARLRPGRALTSPELIIVFFLAFTASAIPGWAFSTYWLSVITGPYYYASPENQWAELFFQYLPSWLIVSNNGHAMEWFFEGLPKGQAVPWSVWVVPLFWWSTFFFALFCAGASAMVILRKQWVESERLTFPLARIPLALVQNLHPRSALPAITKDRLFWFGFGMTLAILIWNIFSFFDAVPPIPIGAMYVTNVTIAQSFPGFPVKFNYLIAGVAFFTNLDVLASVWVFFIISLLQIGVMNRLGVPATNEVVLSQHLGGFFVFILFCLWAARRHLRDVVRKALGRAQDVDDSTEFFSYRIALCGLVFGLLYIIFWLHAAGMSYGIVLFLIGSLFLMYVGVARIVAETGLVFLDLPYNGQDFTVAAIGSAQIAPHDLMGLTLAHTYARNWRTLGMCSMIHVNKVGDEMGGHKRGIFALIILTLVVSVATAIGYTMYLGYATYGAYQFGEVFGEGSRNAYTYLIGWIKNAKIFSGMEFTFLFLGGVFTAFLIVCHHRLPWWPLHPIGFGVVRTPGVGASVFSILVAWLVKAILIKIGGVQLYRKAQPFAIGMIVAFAVGVMLSFIVDLIWFPQSGHPVQNW
ncbi:MAG: hypothetical protein HY710_09675 [Candidatus Latescibacteria bacterium]|nr:hypothetical protein [Candidatus Latescibacterota bacterium]